MLTLHSTVIPNFYNLALMAYANYVYLHYRAYFTLPPLITNLFAALFMLDLNFYLSKFPEPIVILLNIYIAL